MPNSYVVPGSAALKPLDLALIPGLQPDNNHQVKPIVEDALAKGIQRIVWWLGSSLVRRGYLQPSVLRKLIRSIQTYKEKAAQDKDSGVLVGAQTAGCDMASHIRQHGFNNPMGVACIGPGRIVVAGALKLLVKHLRMQRFDGHSLSISRQLLQFNDMQRMGATLWCSRMGHLTSSGTYWQDRRITRQQALKTSPSRTWSGSFAPAA
jgi:hypothetical protein